ncbi:MAG: L-seryl-tRNA(Ser) seleniumtransferase [Kiritimatiellia bacterium]|jgi:L-seryl-tRNA(Ser) seleniumtransferase
MLPRHVVLEDTLSALFRQLPKMDLLLAHPLVCELPRELAHNTATVLLQELRAGISEGSLTVLPDVASIVADRVTNVLDGRSRPVINATGVIVHTNLGRAPWAPQAIAAAVAAAGYTNLEMRLETGQRGGRLEGVQRLVKALVGAEDTIVVNNGAAAVLLALTALARGREVVVSRGELVEIGGSFRVPDVISSGGAHLVEVGTTNRTRADDYEAAITPQTGALLAVHRSNFRIVGFTEQPSLAQLAEVGRRHGVPVVHDLGSGALRALGDEPLLQDSIDSGVDLVICSGDKLLGGPQAGLIIGRADVVQVLRRHPLYRALRVDKVTLAALEATLALHVRGQPTPIDAMLYIDVHTLDERAEALCSELMSIGIDARVEPGVSRAGGGSLPGEGLPSRVVRIAHDRPHDVHHALRTGEVAVVARVGDGALWFDVRTLNPEHLNALPALISRALDRQQGP